MTHLIPKDTATWIPLTIQSAIDPLIHISSAKGEFLYDEDGREFIDGIASWWTNIHGHCHPEIVAAITKQAQTLDHVMLAGFIHDPAENLARKILSITNSNFKKVFYSDNGSNAVEICLKIAVQYFINENKKINKSKFITFSSSYHGDSIGAMNVSGLTFFNRIFANLRFPIFESVAPNCYLCPVGKQRETCEAECVTPVRTELEKNAELYAGIVIEPLVFGASGMVFYDSKVLQSLERLAREFDVLLIFDEVFTGMGRTGEYFAYQRAGVRPDLVAFAKGLTGGTLPLAASLVTGTVYDSFLNDDPYSSFFHAHTMMGNPIACSAGLASIGILERESLKHVVGLEKKFKIHLDHLISRHPEKILSPRILGSILAFDLSDQLGEDEYLNPIGKRLRAELLKNYVLLRPLGNTVYITPPYNISDVSLEKIFYALDQALSSI